MSAAAERIGMLLLALFVEWAALKFGLLFLPEERSSPLAKVGTSRVCDL
jgi:hypothetical protein